MKGCGCESLVVTVFQHKFSQEKPAKCEKCDVTHSGLITLLAAAVVIRSPVPASHSCGCKVPLQILRDLNDAATGFRIQVQLACFASFLTG